MKFAFLTLSLVVPFLLASCNPETQETVAAPTIALDSYFTSTAPADPQAIHQIRSTAKPGETVTVSGLVMGREKPFVEGRAAFILGDLAKLTPCNRIPDDHCDTPWDVCCDTPEAKRDGTATIQIVGADHRVLKQSLKGANGLKELSEVTLTGTVDKASTADALIINATAMHVSESR